MTISGEELGKRIKQLREYRGMTQAELAQDANLTSQAIGNYERGTRKIDIVTFLKIRQTLDFPINFFLDSSELQETTTVIVTQKSHLLQ